MCGIGSITLDKTAAPSVAKRLDAAADALLAALDHRGGDACGILAIGANGELAIQKAPCVAKDFTLGRIDIPIGTRAVAVHTRMATQGEAHWNRNNHPVQAGTAHVMHNGVVWESFGRKRTQGEPEVDTYALAVAAFTAATASAGKSIPERANAIADAMAQEDGSAAVHVAFEGHPTLITARLAGSPLYVAEAHGVRITASTRDAVKDAAKALGLALPNMTSSYIPKQSKRQKKKGITPNRVNYVTEAIDFAPEGTVLLWHAGTHTRDKITLPLPNYSKAWKTYAGGIGTWDDEDEAWYQEERAKGNTFSGTGEHKPQTTPDYAGIAGELLEANGMRCELCDDVTHHLTPEYGMLVCNECLAAMDATPEHEKVR